MTGRVCRLGEAFAHFKTLHLLQFISDEGYRRVIGTQLNVQEARHRLARRIAFGQRGQRYREGMEDQLGALGLALNAVVWWNSLYLDAAVKQIRADGFPVTGEMCGRLSPIAFEHINFLGGYAFPAQTRGPVCGRSTRPETVRCPAARPGYRAASFQQDDVASAADDQAPGALLDSEAGGLGVP